jgi:hypothetical protein
MWYMARSDAAAGTLTNRQNPVGDAQPLGRQLGGQVEEVGQQAPGRTAASATGSATVRFIRAGAVVGVHPHRTCSA